MEMKILAFAPYTVSYFLMTLVVAGIAQGKNRGGLNWWFLATFLTPPIALFILVAFCDKPGRK